MSLNLIIRTKGRNIRFSGKKEKEWKRVCAAALSTVAQAWDETIRRGGHHLLLMLVQYRQLQNGINPCISR
ncbi:MAG: hypothetical protein RLZZ165_1839 [Bacteroidota bacterium]